MRTLLPGLGTVALGLAVLLTLALALTTKMFTLRPPGGPDAMGLIVVFFLPVAAWVLVLLAALAAVARGGFDWVSASPGMPTLAVLGAVVGLAGLSVAATMFSLEVRYASRTVVGLAGGLVLPLAAIGLAGFLLRASPETVVAARWLRPAGAGLSGLAALAACGGFVLLVLGAVDSARAAERDRLSREARSEAMKSEDAVRREVQAAELAALPDDTPIEVFATHLFIDKSEEHHQTAVERIRALSDLTGRLGRALEHPEALQREYVLNFVRMAGSPDPAWEPLVREALVRLAADYRAEAEAPTGRITHVRGLALGALRTAAAFGPLRFEAEARALGDAIGAWPDEDARRSALEVVDLYLAGKPLPD